MTQINLAGKHTLPDGWQAKRLKFLCSTEQSGVWGDEAENCQDPTPVATTADIDSQGKADIAGMTRRCLSQEERERYMCKHGDIIVVKSSGSATNVISGKVAIARSGDDAFAFGNFMLRLRPKLPLVEPEFLFHFLMSPAVKDEIRAMVSTTTYPNLQVGEYLSFSVPLPDVSYQRQLVTYLDKAAGKVDGLVALRRRQMELLREHRVALIQQAVTLGLNPTFPLKDSGLPWLGQIPKHWKVERNKVIFREIDLRSADGSEELLTVSHITGVTPRAQKEQVNMFLAESNEGYKRVEIGDLAINTMWAWMGALGFSKYSGIVSPSYNVYRFRQPAGANANYYELLFRSPNFIKEIIRYSTGVWESRLRLYPEAFFEIRSPMPPLEEQKEIVEHVERITRRTEAILSAYSRQLELLAEFRSALIHECVTGQRNVGEPVSLGESS